MSKIEMDRYFHELWVVLTSDQKQSVLNIMKSFSDNNETRSDEANANLNEPETGYDVPVDLFKSLKKKQRKALISFIEASGVESLGGETIEEYNRDLEEAEAEIERGEFYTHEEVVERSKTWLSGKKKS